MIQIGTYVHGGGNYEEKIIDIKNAGFDFVAIGMGALSDGTLEYQVELCKKYGLEIDNIHLTGGKTTEIWFEGELGDKVCERYCREIRMARRGKRIRHFASDQDGGLRARERLPSLP